MVSLAKLDSLKLDTTTGNIHENKFSKKPMYHTLITVNPDSCN